MSFGRLVAVAAAVTVAGCECNCPEGQMCGPLPPSTASATLTIAESNPVLGDKVTGTTNAISCKVVQMRILVNGEFVTEVPWKGANSPFEVRLDSLVKFFPNSQVSASLTFQAEAACELKDGEAKGQIPRSQPQTVVLFPTKKVVTLPNGGQALPDTFVAEGGNSGRATTFLGCNGGNSLIRVSDEGMVLKSQPGLPFSCDYRSSFTAKSTTAQRRVRWLVQPEQGAVAFISEPGAADDLSVTNYWVKSDSGREFTVTFADDQGADVFIQEQTSQEPFIYRVPGLLANGELPPRTRWNPLKSPGGVPNAGPVINLLKNEIYISNFEILSGGTRGIVKTYKINYLTGAVLLPATQIWTGMFASLNTPIVPRGLFTADGARYYLMLLGSDSSGNPFSQVFTCPTNTGTCSQQGVTGTFDRFWTGPQLPGLMAAMLERGGTLAVTGSFSTYFLDTATGKFKGDLAEPVRPTGSLAVTNLTDDTATDIFIMNSPVAGEGVATFPTELVAIEPGTAVLWRLPFGVGTQPQSAMWLAVDEGKQTWLRVGVSLVLARTKREYCQFINRACAL
jgi:hypothetical protein